MILTRPNVWSPASIQTTMWHFSTIKASVKSLFDTKKLKIHLSKHIWLRCKGKSVYTVKKEDQIKAEIMKNGPVQTAFTVYEDFVSYKTGVYQHVTGNELGKHIGDWSTECHSWYKYSVWLGGHAVKIVGWGVDSSVPYWLVANSWNTDWAENGYFRILRGKNECGIEDGVVAGIVVV